MARKPLTKTQIVTQMSETMQVPKKQAAAWFKSIADLAAKETKRTGQFIIPVLPQSSVGGCRVTRACARV